METFFLALAFNWLIGGTDAHAKNYSLLLGEAGSTRLAPLYDLSSVLPYPRQVNLHKARMAMRIGSHYRWWDIRPRDWQTLATELGLGQEQAINVLASTARILPDMAARLATSIAAQEINHPVIPAIVDGIALAAKRILGALDAMQQHGSSPAS
jgi:serine/threonine-protein kinase HipA